MDMIINRFSPRGRAIFDLVTSVCFFLFVGVLLWAGLTRGLYSLEIREMSDSMWRPPVYPVKLLIPVVAFLMLIQGVAKFMDDLSTVIGRKAQ